MKRIIVGVLGGLVTLAGVLLAFSRGKPRPVVDANGQPVPGSLSEKIWVNINGVQQGMFIQSKDLNNPVCCSCTAGRACPNTG